MTKSERIERFKEIMKPCMGRTISRIDIPINKLIENGYFTCPASLHHHGKY